MSTVVMTTFADVVAGNIRAECARAGLNQSDVARALDVSVSAVSLRWKGRRQWQLEDIEKVAHLIGVPPSELCAARDSNPEPSGLQSAWALAA